MQNLLTAIEGGYSLGPLEAMLLVQTMKHGAYCQNVSTFPYTMNNNYLEI